MVKQTLGVEDVVGSTFALPGVSGGLNEGLKIEHQEFQPGDRVYVVIEAVVVDVGFKAVDRSDPTGPKKRHHVAVAEGSFFANKADVGALVEANKARLTVARDEERNQMTLQTNEQMALEHKAGKHKRLKKDCAECEREKDLAAKENAAKENAAKKAAAAKKTADPSKIASTSKARRDKADKA